MPQKLNFLIAAGGTGGHLFPALALAEELKASNEIDANIQFIGGFGRIEERVVPEQGYKLNQIEISGFSGLSLKSLALPFKIVKAIRKSRNIIKDDKIDAVVCAGAYLSYPPGIAAKQTNTPLYLMESNVNPGKVIKMLSTKATRIFTSFEDSVKYFDGSIKNRISYLGNPVRSFIGNSINTQEAKKKFNLDPDRKALLIFGGSLGARSINLAVENSLNELSGSDYQIIWQTGKNYQAPQSLPSNIHQMQFIDDMGSAYAASEFVISRSGATTVAELCQIGKASVLVPLPSASNMEQSHNAQVMENKGAAILVNDNEIGTKIIDLIKELSENPEKVKSMGDNALKMANPNAAKEIAQQIISEILKKK